MTSQIVSKELGTVVVRTDGKGYWSSVVKEVPLKIIATVDLNTIERDEAGKLDFVYSTFRGYFDAAFWNEAVDGLMYTDDAVETAVNSWLQEQGLPAVAYWSEQGMQGDDYADFDMDDELLFALFPEQVKETE